MRNYIKEFWTTDKTPNAKLLRDKRARELRKLGYIVESKTVSFSDLAWCTYYGLEANKNFEKQTWICTTCLKFNDNSKLYQANTCTCGKDREEE